jgi:hypothetical protein
MSTEYLLLFIVAILVVFFIIKRCEQEEHFNQDQIPNCQMYKSQGFCGVPWFAPLCAGTCSGTRVHQPGANRWNNLSLSEQWGRAAINCGNNNDWVRCGNGRLYQNACEAYKEGWEGCGGRDDGVSRWY